MKRRMLIIALGALLALVAVMPVATAQANPPRQNWGELGAEWWQWALKKPVHKNPMNGDYTGGAQCAGGGAGGVRFLAGSFSNIAEGGEPVERSCNTPAGLPIFFPVITVESSVAEGDGKNEAELRKAANSVMDDVEANTDKIYAKVDGKDVLATRSRRADSPLFTWVVPKNNVFILLGRDIPPGPSKAVTDGIWVKLPPLSKGHHVVKFGGSFFEGAVIQKNTYHLTVR